jgi:hypothetical protein
VIDLDDAAAATVTRFDRLRALTSDPRFGHRLAGVSPDDPRVHVGRGRAARSQPRATFPLPPGVRVHWSASAATVAAWALDRDLGQALVIKFNLCN